MEAAVLLPACLIRLSTHGICTNLRSASQQKKSKHIHSSPPRGNAPVRMADSSGGHFTCLHLQSISHFKQNNTTAQCSDRRLCLPAAAIAVNQTAALTKSVTAKKLRRRQNGQSTGGKQWKATQVDSPHDGGCTQRTHGASRQSLLSAADQVAISLRRRQWRRQDLVRGRLLQQLASRSTQRWTGNWKEQSLPRCPTADDVNGLPAFLSTTSVSSAAGIAHWKE